MLAVVPLVAVTGTTLGVTLLPSPSASGAAPGSGSSGGSKGSGSSGGGSGSGGGTTTADHYDSLCLDPAFGGGVTTATCSGASSQHWSRV